MIRAVLFDLGGTLHLCYTSEERKIWFAQRLISRLNEYGMFPEITPEAFSRQLQKNAEALHQASVETAKESERGVVDIETLKKTNADLIQTLDDVLKIQQEGKAKRRAAEQEMARMEQDLKKKLLEIQH